MCQSNGQWINKKKKKYSDSRRKAMTRGTRISRMVATAHTLNEQKSPYIQSIIHTIIPSYYHTYYHTYYLSTMHTIIYLLICITRCSIHVG